MIKGGNVVVVRSFLYRAMLMDGRVAYVDAYDKLEAISLLAHRGYEVASLADVRKWSRHVRKAMDNE